MNPPPGRCLAACLLLLHGLAPAAVAQEDEASDRGRRGVYLGASFAGMVPLFEADPMGLNAEQDGSYGYQLKLGYRLTEVFAAEFQYERAEGFSTTGALEGGVARARLLTGNLRMIAPLQGPTQPYLLAGVGAGQYWIRHQIDGISPLRGKQWELAARFGAGIDYWLTDHFVLNIEAAAVYSDSKILIERFPFVSIGGGLNYRF